MKTEIIIEIDGIVRTMDLDEYIEMVRDGNPLHTVKGVK